jgi:hypothetical protein
VASGLKWRFSVFLAPETSTMTKRISFLCVVWAASLAFGEDSPPKAVADKAPEATKAVAPEATKATVEVAPPAAPGPAFAPEKFNEMFSTPAPEKSSPFSQFPAGFSMKFNVEGSFTLSFEMGVGKDQAKAKTHKAKTKKNKATEKAKSEPKTETAK